MDKKKAVVAVAGATGRTGGYVVQELFKRGFSVRALVRSSAKASWIAEKGGETFEADISSVESLEKAMAGSGFVISALGSNRPFSSRENSLVDNMGIVNLTTAARKLNMKRIVVVSSIGVGDSRNAIFFLFRMLMHSVLKMKEKSEIFVKQSGMDYTIIRPGGLSEKKMSGEVAFGTGGKISGFINRKDVARVCVDALTSEKMKNKILEVVDRASIKESKRVSVVEI